MAGKLKIPKTEKVEGAPETKRKHGSIMGGASINEAPGEINTKQFGHVIKTARKLHGSDPYKAAHKY